MSDSKGTKKRWEPTNTVKVAEQKATRAARKEHKLLKIEAKKKNMVKHKKTAKATKGKDQLVQQPPVPVTLEEYVQGEWFRMMEDENEVLYSFRMISRY